MGANFVALRSDRLPGTCLISENSEQLEIQGRMALIPVISQKSTRAG